MHLRALGEGHDARVQEDAGAVGHRELPVARVEPRAVQQHRDEAGDDGAGQGAPADPPDDDVHREEGQERQPLRPDRGRHAQDQADQRAALPRRLAVPQQQRGRQDEQELEQDVAEDQVLELDLEAVVQHRDRGQRGDPGPDAEPVPGQRVHHDADRQAHQVLQDRYDREAVQRFQDLQEYRVAGRARHVRVQADHVAHVLERVVEPGLPPIAQLSVGPQEQRRDQQQGEQPVSRDQSADPGRRMQRPDRAS